MHEESPMPLDPDLTARIFASVEQRFEAQLAFTKEMMRSPSTRGAEHAVQDMVIRALKDRGFALDRFEMDESALRTHVGSGFISELHSRVRSWWASIGRARRRADHLSSRPMSTWCRPDSDDR